MTPEEIHEQIKFKREQIALLKREIIRLKDQYPVTWKLGDRYTTSKGTFEVVSVPDLDDDGRLSKYYMKVAKLKKDGTPSNAWQYPYEMPEAPELCTK